jgi:2-dehydropantoate 2-reductase
MEKLRPLVFGAGAIGTYVGGSLALAGNPVVFVEQPAGVEELRGRGLRLDLTVAHRSVFNIQGSSVGFASSLEEALKTGPFDIAIFTLKSFDTSSAMEGMKAFANELPPILCLSNGVDNESAIESALGSGSVIAGTVTSSVGRRAIGDIVLERRRGVGVADGHPLSLLLAEALNSAGLNTRLFRRSADMKWSKMLTNLPANASAAILNMTAAEVFNHPALFRLEMRMLREATAVMRTLGFRVVDLPGVPVRALALGTKLPGFLAHPLMQQAIGGGRGGKMPSFHIDLYSGRGRSEVEWLNGAVVRYGQRAGVKTPVNQVLTDILLALTRGNLSVDSYSHHPEKLLSQIY